MTEPYNPLLQNFDIKVVGVPKELELEIRKLLNSVLDMVSQRINLIDLDGLTFAIDYHQALLDLDRGYETNYKLTPSNDHGIGIAMSPCVMRNKKLKTHIVINAEAFLSALKISGIAINTIAHECAHVELNRMYDEAFPGTLLRKRENVLDHFRTECMLTCWNEFGACWRSASFGPTEFLFYEAAFLPALKETRAAANAAIMKYRTHGDIETVASNVCELYQSLLKYSAYHLGNLHGHGVDWRTVQTTDRKSVV